MISILSTSEIEDIISIAFQAGISIMKNFDLHKGDLKIKQKVDTSPVTKADIESNEIICNALNKKFPHFSILSEEVENTNVKSNDETYFIIDPLDGTESFIGKTHGFAINIALIHEQKAVFGLIYIPYSQECYYTDTNFVARYRAMLKNSDLGELDKDIKLKVTDVVNNKFVAVTNLSYKESNRVHDLLTQCFGNKSFMLPLSSSNKFCTVVENCASIYLRTTGLRYWDIAAGDALIHACKGCIFVDWEGNEIVYDILSDHMSPKFIGGHRKFVEEYVEFMSKQN